MINMKNKQTLSRQNSAISNDKKYYSSRLKNETDSKQIEKSSKQVVNNKTKGLITNSQELHLIHQKTSLTRIPSLMNQRKISDKNYPINSADATRCYEENSQLIQQLIEENMQLQKQNMVKDSLITQLITNNVVQRPNQERVNTTNTERQYFKPIKKINEYKQIQHKSTEEPIALGFTFCNTNSIKNKLPKSPNRLPKEFQATPNQNKFFV